MKAMIFAFLSIIVIAVAADFGLGQLAYSSGDKSAGNAVRLQ